jgi:hypothetical protein
VHELRPEAGAAGYLEHVAAVQTRGQPCRAVRDVTPPLRFQVDRVVVRRTRRVAGQHLRRGIGHDIA